MHERVYWFISGAILGAFLSGVYVTWRLTGGLW